MIALATEVTVWLLVSSALGVVAGFALARALSRPAAGAPPRVITDDEEIKSLIAELRREQVRKDDEMSALRNQLEELRQRPEPSADAHAATEEVLGTLREQVDRLRTERDDRVRQLENFKEQNTSLQRRLDETADRLVEFERRRMQSSAPDASGARPAVAPPSAGASPPDGPAPVQPRDPAVHRERERQFMELDVEKSSPLQVDGLADDPAPAEPLAKSEPPAEPESDSGPQPAEPAPEADSKDPGREQPLAAVGGISVDLVERLALVGARTNLELLRKAGGRTRRGALATSMRLETAALMDLVHRCDLARVGLREEDVARLHAAGVRTLASLAAARAEALSNRLQSVGQRGAGRAGTVELSTVTRWIETAKALDPIVED